MEAILKNPTQKTENTIKLNITALSHEGRGIAHKEGKIIFVDGGLPNETLLCRYTKRSRRYDEAAIVEVLEASPLRVNPRCQFFTICGGCQLQHMEDKQQLELKQQTLLEQFKHFGHLQPEELLPPLAGPQWGYRHKARLGVRYVEKKQKLLVGFHEKNGRYLADITQCEILHPKVGLLIKPLTHLIQSLSVYKSIAQIEVAIGEQAVALIFRNLIDLANNDILQLINFAKLHQIQIYLQPNPPQTIHRIYPTHGEENLSYTLLDEPIHLQFHPTDFTQINPFINQQMVKLALTLLELSPSDEVLDLFCGLGNFTLPIAKYCLHATGVEGSTEMVERATDNAKRNQINNTQFFKADLASTQINGQWLERKYHKILLDPPRVGALDIIRHFPRWKAERIVYISCNPATLARDAGELINQGYRLAKAGTIDMFPQTKHVESIALFLKG